MSIFCVFSFCFSMETGSFLPPVRSFPFVRLLFFFNVNCVSVPFGLLRSCHIPFYSAVFFLSFLIYVSLFPPCRVFVWVVLCVCVIIYCSEFEFMLIRTKRPGFFQLFYCCKCVLLYCKFARIRSHCTMRHGFMGYSWMKCSKRKYMCMCICNARTSVPIQPAQSTSQRDYIKMDFHKKPTKIFFLNFSSEVVHLVGFFSSGSYSFSGFKHKNRARESVEHVY